MKRYILWIFVMIALLMMATSVFAAIDLSSTSIQLGDKNKEASNPEDDDGDPKENTASTVLTVTNNMGSELTDVKCIFTLNSEDSDIISVDDTSNKEDAYLAYLNLQCTSLLTTIAAGATDQFTINARIPAGLDAVDSDGKETSFRVAQFQVAGKINSSEVQSSNIEIRMQRENNLWIDDVVVSYDGKDESVNDGDNINELKPGMSFDVEIIAENTYSNSDGIDIEDIDIFFVIDDSDFDVDEDDNLGDLSTKDKDSVTLSFEADDDTPDGSYKAEILTIGTDMWGARMGEKWDVDFKIERKSHEIMLTSFTANPTTLSCTTKTITTTTRFVNIGKRDEDEVVIELDSPDLNYNQKLSDISLDEDDSTTKTFTIPVPDDLKEGTYAINAKTYFDSTFLSDQKEILITVPDCSPEPTATPTPTPKPTPTETVIIQPPVTQPPVVQPPVVQPPVTQEPVDEEPVDEVVESNIGLYIGVLVVLIVILLLVGIFMVIYIMKDTKQ